LQNQLSTKKNILYFVSFLKDYDVSKVFLIDALNLHIRNNITVLCGFSDLGFGGSLMLSAESAF